jgi:ABC-type glycerol-3-phosphate transport system permease component
LYLDGVSAITSSLRPGAIVSVIAFFDGWNEYLRSTRHDRGVACGVASVVHRRAGDAIELVFAATAFQVVPVVFYFLLQRYFVSGLTSGALKG